MLILVPLKPAVLFIGLLSGLVLLGFIGSSLIERTNPLAILTKPMPHAVEQQGERHTTPEHKHARRVASNQAQ